MAYTFEELKHKTVAELRDIAKGIEHEAVQGHTQMNKEHLLRAISNALGIQHEYQGSQEETRRSACCTRSWSAQGRAAHHSSPETSDPQGNRLSQ
jgi:hypothetical protein